MRLGTCLAKSIFEGLGTDGLDEKMQRCALDNKPKSRRFITLKRSGSIIPGEKNEKVKAGDCSILL
jgi:hypothetical protein